MTPNPKTDDFIEFALEVGATAASRTAVAVSHAMMPLIVHYFDLTNAPSRSRQVRHLNLVLAKGAWEGMILPADWELRCVHLLDSIPDDPDILTWQVESGISSLCCAGMSLIDGDVHQTALALFSPLDALDTCLRALHPEWGYAPLPDDQRVWRSAAAQGILADIDAFMHLAKLDAPRTTWLAMINTVAPRWSEIFGTLEDEWRGHSTPTKD